MYTFYSCLYQSFYFPPQFLSDITHKTRNFGDGPYVSVFKWCQSLLTLRKPSAILLMFYHNIELLVLKNIVFILSRSCMCCNDNILCFFLFQMPLQFQGICQHEFKIFPHKKPVVCSTIAASKDAISFTTCGEVTMFPELLHAHPGKKGCVQVNGWHSRYYLSRL